MNHIYTTPLGFAHAVRYRDAMIQAWCKRTGRMDKSGAHSYFPADCPYDQPTNDERGNVEAMEFVSNPLPYGTSYFAYLSTAKPAHQSQSDRLGCHPDMWRGVITTFNGELLAIITHKTSYNAVCFGRDAGMKGSFRAIGIDGRQYYGRHNGTGMYCRMRLAKYRTDFDIQQHTSEGWETVSSTNNHLAARQEIREYRENQPEYDVRVKRVRVVQ